MGTAIDQPEQREMAYSIRRNVLGKEALEKLEKNIKNQYSSPSLYDLADEETPDFFQGMRESLTELLSEENVLSRNENGLVEIIRYPKHTQEKIYSGDDYPTQRVAIVDICGDGELSTELQQPVRGNPTEMFSPEPGDVLIFTRGANHPLYISHVNEDKYLAVIGRKPILK